jgi:hypothetical protein
LVIRFAVTILPYAYSQRHPAAPRRTGFQLMLNRGTFDLPLERGARRFSPFRNGFPGLHFIAHVTDGEPGFDYKAQGLDACVRVCAHRVFRDGRSRRMRQRYLSLLGRPRHLKSCRDALPFSGRLQRSSRCVRALSRTRIILPGQAFLPTSCAFNVLLPGHACTPSATRRAECFFFEINQQLDERRLWIRN